jgi:hypothetical protein
MSNTWLIDSIWILVENNHGVLLYPEWSNTSDYMCTSEGFGTIAIHSDDLASSVEQNQLPTDYTINKLTNDQHYLCKTMDTKLPFCLFMARKNIGCLRNLFCWSLHVLTLTKWQSSGTTMLMALKYSQNYQYIFELTIPYGPETNKYRML